MTGVLDALYKRLLLAAHPVGSVYQSTVDTSPESLFGGTWEEIRDVFLLAAGTRGAGSTGGEAEHTLSIYEMPNHTHSLAGADATAPNGVLFGAWCAGATRDTGDDGGRYYPVVTTTSGGGVAHNNMPPYLAIYMWQRTA